MSDVDPLGNAYCLLHSIYLCDECYKKDRLTRFHEALNTCLHAFAEIDHARKEPNWFTRGEDAAWQHAGEWIRKGVTAAKVAIELAKDV